MAIRSGSQARLPLSPHGRIRRDAEGTGGIQAGVDASQAKKTRSTEAGHEAAGTEGNPPPAVDSPAPPSEAVAQQQRDVARDFHAAQQKTIPQAAKNPLSLRMAVMTDQEHLAGDALLAKTRGKHGGIGDQADTAQGNLDVAALATRADGGSFGAQGDHLKLNTFATGVSGGLTHTHDVDGDGDHDATTSNDASLSRAGLTLGYTHSNVDDGSSVTGGVFLKKGFQAAHGSYGWADKEGDRHSLGGMLGGNRKSLLVSLSGSRTAAGSDVKVRGGGIALATFHRQAKDLGEYAGDDPHLQGKRRVEVERNLGGSLIGSGGLGAAFGIGGRIAPAKGKNVVYRTHLESAEAHSVVHEGKGAAQFLRDKARALGLKEENVDIPDLSRPESMRVGDELVVDVTGGMTMGLSLGGFNASAGVQGTTVGEFELAARKLDDNRVELCVTPTHVKGIQVSAHAPFILEVSSSRMQGRALRQAFVFDLSQPGAREAYQQALKGDLPNGMPKDAKEIPKRPGELAELVRNEKLPGGVERTYLERLDLQSVRQGGGLNWGVIDAKFGLAGLAYHKTEVDETRTVADGQRAVSVRTRGVDRRRQVLLSGTESLGVYASMKRSTTFDEGGRPVTRFGGLELSARFTDDTVRGLELNGDMIDKINGAFGTEIPHFQVKGHKQSREITVARKFSADDLEQLARLPSVGLRKAADAAGLGLPAVARLQGELRARQTPVGRAQAVQEWIEKEGLIGMGALHRALGGERAALSIQTTSDAYTAPLDDVKKLTFEHRGGISPDADKSTLGKLFKAARKIFEKIDNGIVDTYDDPLLDEKARLAHREGLVKARRELNDHLSFDHLSPEQRTALYDRVDRGWTTSVHKDILARLDDAGLA